MRSPGGKLLSSCLPLMSGGSSPAWRGVASPGVPETDVKTPNRDAARIHSSSLPKSRQTSPSWLRGLSHESQIFYIDILPFEPRPKTFMHYCVGHTAFRQLGTFLLVTSPPSFSSSQRGSRHHGIPPHMVPWRMYDDIHTL